MVIKTPPFLLKITQIVPSLYLSTFDQTISIFVEDFQKVITLLLIMIEKSGLCHFKANNLIFRLALWNFQEGTYKDTHYKIEPYKIKQEKILHISYV